jgi:orotidine-5'-phosphate decarboxylase
VAEVIVALDVREPGEALGLVDRLGDEAGFYKVGLELYTRWGSQAVRELRDRGKRVFLDLKLHDIPNTVAAAVRAAADHGVDLLTVHAVGGPRMLEAAVRASRDVGGPALLAVTILTSMDVRELSTTWGRDVTSMQSEVLRLAELSRDAGMDGVVASAREAASLRRRLGPAALLVTPGIRPAGADAHDQTRVATPGEAVRGGATHLVLGRTITEAPDPREALRGILREVAAA